MGRARRNTVVSDEGGVNSNNLSAPPLLPEVPSPPLALDIFSKFQSKRDDFEGDWIFMEDDEPPNVAPMSEEMKSRLKERQTAFHAKRHNNEEEEEEEEEARQGSGKSLETGGRDDEEDDEYDPAEQTKLQATKKDRKKLDTGLDVDYLSFLSPAGGKVSAADLHVTLHAAYPHSHHGDDDVPTPRQSSARAGRQATSETSPSSFSSRYGVGTDEAAESAPISFPLWSAKRVKEWGGYCDPERFPTIALHQEITDFVDFMRPTQAEVSIRRHIELEIQRLCTKLWPGSEVVVYGSLRTHLLLPLSDIDMTIANVPLSPEEALPLLAKEIDAAKLTDGAYPQVILKTKVPLIKFQHAGSLVDVDISIAALDGKENTAIVIDLLNTFPEAKALILVIKYFLQQRDMDEPYKGGLGSYATTLLVISFLQQHPIYTTRPEERRTTGLGKLLVDFFRYYGMYWNYRRCGISLRRGGSYFQRDSLGGSLSRGSPTSPVSPNSPRMGPTEIEVEDPGNPENNAASSVRLYYVISSFFSYAYCALTANLPIPKPSQTSKPISPESQEIAQRPTLLSRILHIDSASVQRRRCIESTFRQLCQTQPERMREVMAYKQDEDLALLEGKPRRLLEKNGDGKESEQVLKGQSESLLAAKLAKLRASVVSSVSKEEKDSMEHLAAHQKQQLEAEKGGGSRKRGRRLSGDSNHSDSRSSSMSASSHSSISGSGSASSSSGSASSSGSDVRRRHRRDVDEENPDEIFESGRKRIKRENPHTSSSLDENTHSHNHSSGKKETPPNPPTSSSSAISGNTRRRDGRESASLSRSVSRTPPAVAKRRRSSTSPPPPPPPPPSSPATPGVARRQMQTGTPRSPDQDPIRQGRQRGQSPSGSSGSSSHPDSVRREMRVDKKRKAKK